MKIGITETREKANDLQLKAILEFLSQFPAGTEFHHGMGLAGGDATRIMPMIENFAIKVAERGGSVTLVRLG